MKHLLTFSACLVSIFAHGTVKTDTIKINDSYLITNNKLLTKGNVGNHELGYHTMISVNPPKGYITLFFESIAKEHRNSFNDNSITMEMSAASVDEIQIAGGDLWACRDSWGLYPNGYYSGIGAIDLYNIKKYAVNMICMDFSRTVIQADEDNEKYVFPKHALSGMERLIEVKIPRKTVKIDIGAFKNCSNLKSVNGSCFMNESTRSIRYIDYDPNWKPDLSVLYNYDFSGIHEENEIIDNAFSDFTEIGDSAFYGVQAESVMLPKSFKRMGKAAFGNTNMKEVTFYGSNVPLIDTEAFGKNEKDSVILYVPKDSLSSYKRMYGDRFKAIREIGYISPNPVKIYLKESKLYIEIKEDASETGYVLINNKNKVDLKQGKNVIDLKLNEEYQVVVGDEEYMLNRYEL